jgi:transposase-like protein
MGNSSIRRQHTAAFKSKVALEAIKQTKTVTELASEYAVHPTQIKAWKDKLETETVNLFSDRKKDSLKEKDELIDRLYSQVGKLQTQLSWLKKKMGLVDD